MKVKWTVLMFFVVAALLVGVSYMQSASAGGGTVTVPDVTGMTVSTAIDTLVSKGFSASKIHVQPGNQDKTNPAVLAKVVRRQEPPAGTTDNGPNAINLWVKRCTHTCTPTPCPTVTVTCTATPEPAPTVTVTCTATPEPAPTVTITATPEPAPTVTITATPEPAPTVTVTASPSPEPEPCIDGFHWWANSCPSASCTLVNKGSHVMPLNVKFPHTVWIQTSGNITKLWFRQGTIGHMKWVKVPRNGSFKMKTACTGFKMNYVIGQLDLKVYLSKP
jgi:hypothetical protein